MHRYARRRDAGRWSPPALTLRGYWWALALVAGAIQLVTMGLVTAGILARAGAFALVSLWLGSVLVGIFLVTGSTRATRRGVSLAQGLAAAAREVARTGRAWIPHTDRSDEIGELARALQAWRGASAEREVMIEQAPVGICQLDIERRVVTGSPAFLRMLGLTPEQVRDQPIRSFIHADDLDPHRAALAKLTAGRLDRVAMECRYVRADGSLIWCSTIAAPLRGTEGLPEGFVAIVEDISERRQQMERAARIQRGLLPQSTPTSTAMTSPAPAAPPRTWPATSTTGT